MSFEDEIERSIVRAIMLSGNEGFLKDTSDAYVDNLSVLRGILPEDVEPRYSFLAAYQDKTGNHNAFCCVLDNQIVFVWRNGLLRRKRYCIIPFERMTSVEYYPPDSLDNDPSITVQHGQDRTVFSMSRDSAPLPETIVKLLQGAVYSA